MRGFASRVGLSLRYAATLQRTPINDDLAAPRLRWWRWPTCWRQGHSFEQQAFFSIDSWRLRFCTCCGEEIAGRTRWSQIQPRPDDEPIDIDREWL